MAKSKEELLKEGKQLGLNLKKTMSVYELNARIKEAKEKLPAERKSSSKAKGGEY